MSSKRKTLIYNWVEERQCEPLETENRNPDGTLCTNLHRVGHKGLLSVDAESCSMETSTTSTVSYTSSAHHKEAGVGMRETTLRKELYKMAKSELDEEIAKAAPPPFDFKTIMKEDYTASGFVPQQQEQVHSFNEEPATYWKLNLHTVTGVSPVVDTASPFARNTKFSTPIEQSLHDHNNS